MTPDKIIKLLYNNPNDFYYDENIYTYNDKGNKQILNTLQTPFLQYKNPLYNLITTDLINYHKKIHYNNIIKSHTISPLIPELIFLFSDIGAAEILFSPYTTTSYYYNISLDIALDKSEWDTNPEIISIKRFKKLLNLKYSHEIL